ncbi:PepSY domain-containing protein [Micromonospora yasonensis]|uniref:PepSY domain-containing protein n=1 Tax=Micromonospora yasonensis TaxID=1128667 RepID=UPI0022319D5B|nr:PepSY domain-containing protein [Micromonospora yasonensis]MCW3840892.1 PepSY domain-containing protein [Micromonospora yasonensis]
MRRTSLVLAAVGAIAALAVTGATLGATGADRSAPDTAAVAMTAGDDNPKPDDDAMSAGATPGGTASVPADDTVSRRRAGEIALARTGGGRIVEIEAEVEHGRPVWSVKVVVNGVRYEVEVDRTDGTVVGTERKRTDDRGGDRTRARTDDRTDDHGGTRTGSDDRYDDHGGDRVGDDDRHHDDHGGDRSGSDD